MNPEETQIFSLDDLLSSILTSADQISVLCVQ